MIYFFMIYFDIFENGFQEPNVKIVGNIFKNDFRDYFSMIFRLINVDFDDNFQGPCLDFFHGMEFLENMSREASTVE